AASACSSLPTRRSSDLRGFRAPGNNVSVPADGDDASGIRLQRSVAPPGCGTCSEGFTDFSSSLRFARRTDPALTHSGIVQREERSEEHTSELQSPDHLV